MNATRAPMSTFVMLETAKRLLSCDAVAIGHATSNVVHVHDMADPSTRRRAVRFDFHGETTHGFWCIDSQIFDEVDRV
jgi:hypothetical protein